MADRITIELDFEEVNSEETFKKFKENSKAASKQVSKDFNAIVVNNINQTVKQANDGLNSLVRSLTSVATLILSSPPIGKGLFGTLSRIVFLSGAIDLLAEGIGQLNGRLARTSETLLRLTAGTLAAFSAGLGFAIVKTSQFSQSLGSSLIETFEGIAAQSNKTQKSINVLNSFIENFNKVTGNSIGTTRQWSDQIDQLSQNLNISTSELNKAAQEIISVGSQLGFTGDQLQKLLKISAEYAKVNEKEVFSTAVSIISALNGQAQSAQKLGLKLDQTSVSAFALKEGFASNFDSLTELEKSQVRYNKLLSQYANISGIATVAASSLADQENALEVAIQRATDAFGQGVAKVENLNLVSAAANKVVANVSDTAASLAGVISALGARFLQVAGFVVEYTFKIFLLTKVLAVVNGLLSKNNSTLQLLSKTIPGTTSSIGSLASSLTKGRINAQSLSISLQALRTSLISVSGSFIKFNKLGSVSILKSINSTVTTLAKSVGRLLLVLSPLLLPLAKVAAIAGAIIGSFVILRKAFLALEKRTNVFADAYNALLKEFKSTASVLTPVFQFFAKFRENIVDLAQRGFGVLVLAISKVIKTIASLVESNPLGVFSEETVAKFARITDRLDSFNQSLVASGFKLQEFEEDGTRAIASLAEKTEKSLDEIQSKADNFAKNFAQTIENGVVDVLTEGFTRIGALLNQGGSAFNGFATQVLNIVGDLVINLGKALVAKGLAIDALKTALTTLTGGVAVAAGLGLIALGGLLKSFGGNLAQSTTSGSPSGQSGGVTSRGFDEPVESVVNQPVEERAEAQSQVVVNVDRFVGDDEEARRLADIISDAGAKSGLLLTDVRGRA